MQPIQCILYCGLSDLSLGILQHGRLVQSKAIVVLGLLFSKVSLLNVHRPSEGQFIGLLTAPREHLQTATLFQRDKNTGIASAVDDASKLNIVFQMLAKG